MNYIDVDSIDIAKKRVEMRVAKGGHGIPHKAIERRYYEYLKNLMYMIGKKLIVF